MGKAFTYKKSTITSMSVKGFFDSDLMTIDVDGEEKKLSTLLSEMDGAFIELSVKVKDEQELSEPTESDEDDE